MQQNRQDISSSQAKKDMFNIFIPKVELVSHKNYA